MGVCSGYNKFYLFTLYSRYLGPWEKVQKTHSYLNFYNKSNINNKLGAGFYIVINFTSLVLCLFFLRNCGGFTLPKGAHMKLNKHRELSSNRAKKTKFWLHSSHFHLYGIKHNNITQLTEFLETDWNAYVPIMQVNIDKS